MNKEKIIESMCLTMRHDFGINRHHIVSPISGMTEAERDTLRRDMAQLYEHHITPIVQQRDELLAALIEVLDKIPLADSGQFETPTAAKARAAIAKVKGGAA